VQKTLFASAAIACVMALGFLTSQKVEAAPAVPAAMVQTSSFSLLPVTEWRDRKHRNIWRFWQQRRHRGNDYDRYEGYRGDGHRYRRDRSDRGLLGVEFRTRRDY
jgi:hypothetical protein